MSPSKPVVGIDLGTTNSCIAHYDGNRQVIIPDNDGNRIIPSLVYYDPNNGNVSVGQEAFRKSVNCPSNLIKDSKRLIGRLYNDEFVIRYANNRYNKVKVVSDQNKMAAFSVNIKGQEVIKLPEEVSAEILRHLIKAADRYFGQKVVKVVISIPAYFSNSQKKATKKAAEMIGLEVLKLITEPTAGAVYYLKDKQCDSKVMVFDWGGGTLDISLIKVKNDIFNVRAVYGDSLLGGRDIDEKLFNFFNVKVEKHVDKFERKLLSACLRLKKKLSDCDEVEEVVPGDDEDFELVMTRKRFNDLLIDTFERVEYLVEHALADSGSSASQIDQVVLVGGSSRIPKVKEILQNIFSEEKLKFDINPDEAVAAGASIQAYLLENADEIVEDWEISEVTPLSLGLSDLHNLFLVVIKRNTKIPTMKTLQLTTADNNQMIALFPIYEGERKNCEYNNKLGEFKIENLPQGRAGDVKITANFELNEDGILTVTASEASSGSTNSLSITMGEFRLSERKIDYSLREADRLRIEDKVFRKYCHKKSDLLLKCHHILFDLEKISQKSDREVVEKACTDFRSFVLLHNDHTKAEKIEARFSIIYDSILNILKENNMLELEYSPLSKITE